MYYMVVFDDEMGLCFPYSLDKETGGLECGDEIALFSSRSDAQRAIKISRKREELAAAMGKPVNADFIECRKFVKVRKAVIAKQEPADE